MTPLALLYGSLVGFSLGLTGGGGAIFAVPLLVYGLQVGPREAIGVSLATVGATAVVGFWQRWRAGLVETPVGLLFAVAGMLSAPLGAWLGERVPEPVLLTLFAGLMLVIAVRMWLKARDPAERLVVLQPEDHGPTCRRDPQGVLRWNSRCALLLAAVGIAAGVLSGMFGVGGGFIIVPALVTFSGMGPHKAVGTSMLIVALISLAGLFNQLFVGRTIDLAVVTPFLVGAICGLLLGTAVGRRLSGARLQQVFAAAIVGVALFVLYRNLG